MTGPTLPEEIERQHCEALRLIEEGIPCCCPSSAVAAGGEIPLYYKRKPTCELEITLQQPMHSQKQQQDEEQPNENTFANEKKEEVTEHDVVMVRLPDLDPDDPSCGGANSSTDAEDDTDAAADDELSLKTVRFKLDAEVVAASATTHWVSRTDFPLWSTRGWVDVSAIQAIFRDGYNQHNPSSTTTGTSPIKEQDSNTGLSEPPSKAAPSTTSKGTTKQGTQQQQRNQRQKQTPNTRAAVWSSTNFWDENHAAQHNVTMQRPSHDAWGIRKVMLIFCDDFLSTVYELPWWHSRPDIQDSIRHILDNVLHVPVHRVVRLLLAALPPGVTIPVHHDTGTWVRQTHRVHVPIFVTNPDQVLFRVGFDEHHLHRIDCKPGHVFELNNQAKHAVSNCDQDCRVHLILDYVDEDPVNQDDVRSHQRIRLQPGEVMLQTRRSVDRLADRGIRPTPSFVILGAQKAGTTSLYEYMTQHPLIVKSRRRETHCLDWRWNEKLKSEQQQRAWCHKFYFYKELQLHPSCLTGDSTPSYLLDSARVIPRIQAVWDWPLKFFVMVRDPVQRAESHFAMVTSADGTPAQLQARGTEWHQKTLETVMMEELHHLQACGLIPYWDIAEGKLDVDCFKAFGGTKEEDDAWQRYLSHHVPINTGSHNLVCRGLYELQLRPWIRAFGRDKFMVIRLDELSSNLGVQRTMRRVWQHLQVPPFAVKDASPKNTRQYESKMLPNTREYLQSFYEPHNQRFETLIMRIAVGGGGGGVCNSI